MQKWTKILPFFFVEWMAKKHLERFRVVDEICVCPYEHVLFIVESKKK